MLSDWALVDHKFYNLYGERAARLNSGQSIFKIEGRTWFIKILSPVFLFAPIVYLKKLDKMKDSVATQRNWKTMLSQLADEWKDFTLLASIHAVVSLLYIHLTYRLPSY